MCASYLGVASALVEMVLSAGTASAHQRAELITDVEAAMLAIEGVAGKLDGATDEAILVESLACRYHIQDTIGLVARRCLEALGGMAFISSEDATYLASATSGLTFHPPSRARMAQSLCDYWAGDSLTVV